MNITDMRMSATEIDLLAGMIGEEFEMYRCDEFVFSPAVYRIVGLYVGGRTFALLNETEELDYFGGVDDVASIGVKEVKPEEIKSHIVDGNLVDNPINQVIEDVIVVTDTEFMSKDGVDLYRYDFTAAIIFVLADRQVVFERDCWFSEDITIYRGPDAMRKIHSPEENASKSKTLDVRMERNVEHLKDWSKRRL